MGVIANKKSALVLFTAGKDSCMALNWALKNSYSCTAFISSKGKTTFLSDGPEAPTKLVEAVANGIFKVPTKIINTSDDSYKEDLIFALDSYLSNNKIDLIITGDLNHPDGIINLIEAKLKSKYQKINFISIGKIYDITKPNNRVKYIQDFIKSFNLILFGIRLPDFEKHKNLLGTKLDAKLIRFLESVNIDPLGEDGEYQSICIKKIDSTESIDLKYFETSTHSGRGNSNYRYQIIKNAKFKLIKS